MLQAAVILAASSVVKRSLPELGETNKSFADYSRTLPERARLVSTFHKKIF